MYFEIEGPGKIIRVANGDIKDTDPYVTDNRKAFHGRAMVIIQNKEQAGDIKLKVSSDGLHNSFINILSVN